MFRFLVGLVARAGLVVTVAVITVAAIGPDRVAGWWLSTFGDPTLSRSGSFAAVDGDVGSVVVWSRAPNDFGLGADPVDGSAASAAFGSPVERTGPGEWATPRVTLRWRSGPVVPDPCGGGDAGTVSLVVAAADVDSAASFPRSEDMGAETQRIVAALGVVNGAEPANGLRVDVAPTGDTVTVTVALGWETVAVARFGVDGALVDMVVAGVAFTDPVIVPVTGVDVGWDALRRGDGGTINTNPFWSDPVSASGVAGLVDALDRPVESARLVVCRVGDGAYPVPFWAMESAAGVPVGFAPAAPAPAGSSVTATGSGDR